MQMTGVTQSAFLSECEPPPIRSLQELQDLFWPESLDEETRETRMLGEGKLTTNA